jgi:hypothetical protein
LPYIRRTLTIIASSFACQEMPDARETRKIIFVQNRRSLA